MQKFLLAAAIVCSSLSAHAQTPAWLPSNGLIGWYPFDVDANDYSGNGNHGVATGVTSTTDHLGNPNHAYAFDGATSFIEVADNAGMRVRNVSLGLWVKANAIAGVDNIVEKGNKTDATNELFGLSTNEFAVKKNSGCQAGVGWQGVNYMLNLNEWKFLMGTYDGDTVRMYVNNVLVDKKAVGGPIDSCGGGGSMRFGYNWDSHPEIFDGAMDDAVLYNRALTPCEISQLYFQKSINISSQPKDTRPMEGIAQFSVAANAGTATISYQWQENKGSGFVNLSNGVNYLGVNASVLSVLGANQSFNNRTYRCVLTIADLCPSTTDAAKLEWPVSVTDISKDRNFYIFPNPASSDITISTTAIAGTDFFITDQVGRKIIVSKTIGSQTNISIQALPAGVYFLHAQNEAIKFIKQ